MRRHDVVAALVGLAVLLAAVSGTWAYLRSSRHDGDLVLAGASVQALSSVGDVAVPMDSSTPYSNALEDNWPMIELLLISDARERLPGVVERVDRSWKAYLVADQLWRLSEEGEPTPRVVDVYAASELVADSPDLRSLVSGEGDDARLDNADLRSVQALWAYAATESMAALKLVSELQAQAGFQ